MPTGWFSKRISFNKYVFSSLNTASIEVYGNEEVILEWVEYDIYISANHYFTINRSRSRPWSREIQKILCPEEIKYHQNESNIPVTTRKLIKWREYNDKQNIRRLILDRPNDEKATNYYNAENWEALVNEYDVCPIELSAYLGRDHKLVYEAFMNHEFIKAMKRHCTVWINDNQATIPMLYQDGEICKDKMVEAGKIQTKVQKDETDHVFALIAIKWAVEATPKKYTKPVYPSWHRFINQRIIPQFMFPLVKPVWGETPNRIRLEVERRYDDGNLIARAVLNHLRTNEAYIWVNCYTHGITVKVKETFTKNQIKWTKGQVYRLTESDYMSGYYICNGTLISYEDAFTKFKNCHPCSYEMLCELTPGACNLVLCTDFNTPEWVYMDAHHAAQEKQLICVHVKTM